MQTSNVLVLGLVANTVPCSVFGDTLEEKLHGGDATDVKANVSVIKREDDFKLNAIAEEPKVA